MKFRKRLTRIDITLRHGSSLGEPEPDIYDTIEILPGQSVSEEIESLKIKENGVVVRSIDYKAGYTVDMKYFYV